MNYQNNMDAYYSYAKENRKVDRRQTKSTFIWFLLSILILLLVWAFLSYSNKGNVKNMVNESATLSGVLADKVNEKTPNDVLAIDVKALVPSVQNEEKRDAPDQQLQVVKSSTSIVKESTEIKSLSKSNLEKLGLNNEVNSSAIVENEKVLLSSLLKMTDANTSTDINSSTKMLDVNSTTPSQGTVAKLEVVEELPVDLYHLYIVSKGESMYDIAKKQYGDTEMYVKIVKANPDLTNPNQIREGQEILLPIVNESKNYSDILNFK